MTLHSGRVDPGDDWTWPKMRIQVNQIHVLEPGPLYGLTLKFKPHRINLIFGHSGCGKTRLLRAIDAVLTSGANLNWSALPAEVQVAMVEETGGFEPLTCDPSLEFFAKGKPVIFIQPGVVAKLPTRKALKLTVGDLVALVERRLLPEDRRVFKAVPWIKEVRRAPLDLSSRRFSGGSRFLLSILVELLVREALSTKVPLLLDEPFAWLDGNGRSALLAVLRALTATTQVIVSSGRKLPDRRLLTTLPLTTIARSRRLPT